MLEDLFSPPTWRPVNSDDTLTPKMAKYHEISVYFSTKAIFVLFHAPP